MVLVVALALLLGDGTSRALHTLDAYLSRQKLDATLLPEVVAEARSPLVLFTTEACPACRKAHALLDQLDAPYAVSQVDVSDDARAQFDRLGGKAVPLLVSQDWSITGYDESAYRELVADAANP